jgi:hypothetical protein
MTKPRLLILSLGGTITMVPSEYGGIAPKLGAAELVASVPALAEVAEIAAHSPFRLPSPSLTPGNLVGKTSLSCRRGTSAVVLVSAAAAVRPCLCAPYADDNAPPWACAQRTTTPNFTDFGMQT